MTLLRAVGRTMLASYFVVNGAKALLKPGEYTAEAEPVADKVVPLAQKLAPASVAGYIPSDTTTLVRVSGAAQVVGGLSLATGLGRRLGAGLLALTQLPHVASTLAGKAEGAEQKAQQRSVLLRNVALLGATMIAAGDTEGRPGLSYRAGQAQRQLSRGADKQAKKIARESKKAAKAAKQALASVTE